MVNNLLEQMISKQDLDILLEAWTRMVNCVAHDVTTPLASIRLENNGLKKMLPKLLQGYQLAVQNQLMEPMERRYLDGVTTAATDIENHLNRILDFLALLRLYNQKLVSNVTDPQVHLFVCIQAIIKNYPFSTAQRSLLHIEARHDFQFQVEPFFIEPLFLNLLDNALSHIERVGKGEIYIWAEEEEHYFKLHFKDTAGALSEDALSMVFNWFFVKRDGEFVPGLGFSRLKLLQMGGDIACRAVKDQYTEFVVKFPKV